MLIKLQKIILLEKVIYCTSNCFINFFVGAVSFIAKNFTEQSYKSSLQIFVFGEDHLDNHPSGIRCSIDNFGRMIIASDHVEGSSVSYRYSQSK